MERNGTASHVALCLSSFRGGGGERVMVDLANRLVKEGHQVDLLALSSIGEFKGQVDERVSVIGLDAHRAIFSLPKLMQYLKHERPTVLLALDEPSHLLALMARRFTGSRTRIVLRIGTMLSELFPRYRGMRKFTMPVQIRFWYRQADGIIAVSKGIRDDIVAVAGVDPRRVSVIYQPKNIELLRTKGQEVVEQVWLARKTIPVLLSTGRLREQKNFSLLIRAFTRLVKKIPARLIILGQGREESRLRDLIRELGCEDSVSLPGFVENPYAYMAKADVFVFPSLWEGMPNSLLEAMACGLPVISTDCASGPREILAPDTDYAKRMKQGVEHAPYGILVPVADENALLAAMEELLLDETLRTSYAKAASERIAAFDADLIYPQYARALGV